MKLPVTIKSIIIETVCLLYVLLFVYAALNKLLDFENFQVQLGQSPLLSAFAELVSYTVPAVEFIIAFMLLTVRLRYAGMHAAFSLMVMFTAYIFIMLHFSPFVPCSCGGVLEKLSWNQHLIFNIVFVVLMLIAILLYRTNELAPRTLNFKERLTRIGVTMIFSVTVVTVFFLLSEDTIHRSNNFTRRFPHHPTTFKSEIDLQYDSYYIAGYDDEYVYLGNSTAPLTVTMVNIAHQNKKQFVIQLPKYKFSYTAPRLLVKPPYFYFTDGTVPCIFRGSISDWKPSLVMHKKAYFSLIAPVNANKAALRVIGSKTHENVLATIAYTDSLHLNYTMLEKQIDGIFDTDGMLLYNAQLDKILYTYYYRNEFIIANDSLNSYSIGHTIDTTTQAQIKLAKIDSKKITTLAKQPVIVNKKTATYGNYLFVNAALIGKFEPKDMWKQASIIDVYDLVKNTYAFSFYIYDKGGEKMSEFIISNDLVIVLTGKYLTISKLRSDYYVPWNQKKPKQTK